MARRKKRVTAGGAVFIAAAVGLGLMAAAAAHAGPTINQAVPLANALVIPPDGGPTALVLDPPVGGYIPNISADAAVSTAVSRFDVPDTATISPELALLTDPNYRPVNGDGDPTGPPFWQKLPVWVVTIDGLCFGQEGGGGPLNGSAALTQPAARVTCPNTEAIVFVDAASGKYLMDYSYR